MGKTVVWSPSARQDLKSIVSYIAADNPAVAFEVGQKIIDSSKQIELFMESARMVPEFQDESIRERIVGAYRVIFRSKDEQIEVVRVWHAARGLPRI